MYNTYKIGKQFHAGDTSFIGLYIDPRTKKKKKKPNTDVSGYTLLFSGPT